MNNGVTFHSSSELISLERIKTDKGPKVRYVLKQSNRNGSKETIDQVVDTALLCIGRIPNTSSLDLDKAGVQVDPKSASIIEKNGQTTAPHIWAAGDVTADVSLANVAEMEGIHAVDCILGGKTDKLRFDNLSTIMFFDPLVSAVGMGEQALQKVEPTHLKTLLRARMPYKVAAFHYSLVSSALAKGKPTGFIKLMVTPDEEMTLLGVRAVGLHAATQVGLVSYLIQQKLSVRTLAGLLVGYPDVIEGLQECARLLTGQSIMKPTAFSHQTRLAQITFRDDGCPIVQNLIDNQVDDTCAGIEEPHMWPIDVDTRIIFDRKEMHIYQEEDEPEVY